MPFSFFVIAFFIACSVVFTKIGYGLASWNTANIDRKILSVLIIGINYIVFLYWAYDMFKIFPQVHLLIVCTIGYTISIMYFSCRTYKT